MFCLIYANSEGENQKRSNSGSPDADDKHVTLRGEKPNRTQRHSHSNASSINQTDKSNLSKVNVHSLENSQSTVSLMFKRLY